MKKIYKEARCTNYDDLANAWTVDAWKTCNPNEEGTVVAIINATTADVWWCDPAARLDPDIKLLVDIKRDEVLRSIEEPTPVSRTFTHGERIFWINDKQSGWGTVSRLNNPGINGVFLAAPDDIIHISKDDGEETEIPASCVFQLARKILRNGNPVIWNHNSEDPAVIPFYCPETAEFLGYDDMDGEKDWEVTLFVLGNEPHLNKTKVTIRARTQDEAERLAAKPGSGWGVLESRPLGEDLNIKLNNLLCGKSIDDAPELLAPFGEVSLVDDKIDNASDDEDDDFVMMRSYNVGELYVRIYYGDNSREIGCVEVNEN